MGKLDATTLAVMSNRMDSITSEMTNTVIRAARSTTMAARDFSCCIVSKDHELLSCPEGMPVHVFGMGPSARSMVDVHPDFAEGDAFLHNDPYMGNSHAADHQILVPVFVEGRRLFTSCVKAHQVDVGNALPTTYMPLARDVYEEGACLPLCACAVRLRERRRHHPDVRAPDPFLEIWYGDYLAQLGAARLAERRLKEFCQKFGVETVERFVSEWLDYSERVTADAIAGLKPGRVTAHTTLDPSPASRRAGAEGHHRRPAAGGRDRRRLARQPRLRAQRAKPHRDDGAQRRDLGGALRAEQQAHRRPGHGARTTPAASAGSTCCFARTASSASRGIRCRARSRRTPSPIA